MVDISPVIVIVIDMIIFVFYIGVQNSIKGQVEEGKTKIVEEPSHMDRSNASHVLVQCFVQKNE